MKLFLECKPDETLAVALGVPSRLITHSHSKGRVSKALSKSEGATGLVDEDFGSAEPATLKTFVEVSANHDVRLKLDKTKNNRLIVLCPRLEPWIIKTAKASDVKMNKFNLSESVQDLDADINHRLHNLKRLIDELLELKSPRILHLKTLLSGKNA